MIRVITTFLILFFPFAITAQKVHIDLYAGASNYSGDIQAKMFTFKNSQFAFGLGASYDITSRVKGRIALYRGSVWADDRFNPKNSERNLNFASTIYEAQVAGEINILDLDTYPITPYLFAGVGIFHFDPYTEVSGQKVYLKPLSTEGQGLPGYPKEYGLTQLNIPFGAGFKMRLTDELQIGIELGFRKLFTDYLDDLSSNYVDYNTLLNYKGQLATDLAFRQDELHLAPYPADGTQRGNVGQKDWYFLTLGKLSYLLGTGNKVMGGGNGKVRKKSKLGCPTNVL